MDITFSFDTSKWLFACGVSRRICVCMLCSRFCCLNECIHGGLLDGNPCVHVMYAFRTCKCLNMGYVCACYVFVVHV